MNHFKEFFACPECGRPAIGKDELLNRVIEGSFNFCNKCGASIVSARNEALKILAAEKGLAQEALDFLTVSSE